MKTTQIVGAVFGSVALVSSAAFAAAPLVSQEGGPVADETIAATGETAVQGQAQGVRVANVQGSFSFDQTTVSENSVIANIFQKATAALCSSLPDYDVREADRTIAVGGDVSQEFEATVDDMAEAEGAESYTIGCACASNVPGGGAIVNAEVEGVALESVLALAEGK